MDQPPRKRTWGRTLRRAALLFVLVFGGIIGAALLLHPDSRFPNQWNPMTPLAVTDPVTPLTGWKLRRTAADPVWCRTAVEDYASVVSIRPIRSDNPNCGVPQAMTLDRVGRARLRVETACPTALSLAMWEHHSVQRAALDHMGGFATEILDQGSYNCRQMRTSGGNATRWSTHATAMAIDVRGFRFDNGRDAILRRDIPGDGAEAAFLSRVKTEACKWFNTVLGPSYNALHADHFHLQVRGWGTCR